MRVLLDTNIIIYRENKRVTNYSIGHLFRWLDRLKYEKIIHSYSIDEIKQYISEDPRESMMWKLDAYDVLRTIAPVAPVIASLIAPLDKNENDRIDTALLNEVCQGRVDLLITEDKKLRNKAKIIGLGAKVVSVNTFIANATAQNPALVEYKALAVKKVYFGDVDIHNSFFDSFRDSYAGFNDWFSKKCDEEAYICQDDAGDILGFLYLKTEDENENYSDISPAFHPKKRLKVGTFKVESTGFRLGERFMKIIFDNAIERSVDEVYITLFDDRNELFALSNLLRSWGFEMFGHKTSHGNTENVLVKQIQQYNANLTARQNFPNLLPNKQKYILPIYPQYHTALLPDSILNNENQIDFLDKDACKYALQKVYISWSSKRNIYPGDLVIFYRTGPEKTAKKYTSVLTTVCIVEEVITQFKSEEDFLNQCQNRSVFSDSELRDFWNKHKNNIMILKFVFVKSFVKRPILNFLWERNIVSPPGGPRPFTKLTDSQFEAILSEAQTDLSHFWR